MSLLLSVLQEGIEFLKAQGHEVEVEGFEPASEHELDAFEAEHQLSLPQEMRDILGTTDGFSIVLKSSRDEVIYLFPSLAELAEFRRNWIENDVPLWHSKINGTAPTDEYARTHVQQWIPFEDHYNGDFHCVDCLDGHVYFASHEQVGTVILVAENVIKYLASRSKNGFMD